MSDWFKKDQSILTMCVPCGDNIRILYIIVYYGIKSFLVQKSRVVALLVCEVV